MLIDGESRAPQAVRAAIQEEIGRIAREGVEETLFERVKRATYGSIVRRSDDPSEAGRLQTEAFFSGGTLFDYARLCREMTSDEIVRLLSRYTDPRVSSIAVIRPQGK